MIKCMVCDAELTLLGRPSDEAQLMRCDACGDYYQKTSTGLVALGQFLQRVGAGDERARSAVSRPTPTTLHSFLEVLENFDRTYTYDRAALQGSLRTLFAQLQNRMDSAISRFSKLEFVDDDAIQGMAALREARELVSTASRRNRGVPDQDGAP